MWFFVLWLDGLNDLVSIADNSGSGFIITTTDNELVEPLFDIIVIVGDKTAENKELQRLRFKFIDNDGETHVIQILYDDDSWFEWCFLCRGVFDFFSNRKVLYVILKKRNIINHLIFPHLGTYPTKDVMSQALIDKTLFTFTSWNTHIISFHTKNESLKQFSLVKTKKKKNMFLLLVFY